MDQKGLHVILFPKWEFIVEKLNPNRVRDLPKFTQQANSTPSPPRGTTVLKMSLGKV